jgi:hypothetical protein
VRSSRLADQQLIQKSIPISVALNQLAKFSFIYLFTVKFFGTYTYCLSIAIIIESVTALFSKGTINYIEQHTSEQMFSLFLRIYFFSYISLACVLCAVFPYALKAINTEADLLRDSWIILLVLSSLISCLNKTSFAYFTIVNKVWIESLLSTGDTFIVLLSLLILRHLDIDMNTYSKTFICASMLISTTCRYIVSVIITSRLQKRVPRPKRIQQELHGLFEIIIYCRTAYLSSCLNSLTSQIESLAIGNFVGLEVLGQFSIARGISSAFSGRIFAVANIDQIGTIENLINWKAKKVVLMDQAKSVLIGVLNRSYLFLGIALTVIIVKFGLGRLAVSMLVASIIAFIALALRSYAWFFPIYNTFIDPTFYTRLSPLTLVTSLLLQPYMASTFGVIGASLSLLFLTAVNIYIGYGMVFSDRKLESHA